VARKDHIDGLGAFLLLFCSTLMAINHVLIKIVNGGLHPVFQAGLRSACAVLPILAFAWFMKRRLSVSDGSLWPGILAGIFFAGEFMLLFQALDYTTVSRASIFFYSMPFWTAIAGHFLIRGERLTPVRVTGLLLAFSGVVVAFRGDGAVPAGNTLSGDLFCILAALLWSGIVILARTTRFSKSSPEMQLLYQLVVSAVLLLGIAPLFGEPVRDFDALIGVLFAIQVLVVVCIGFLTWFWVLSIYPASDMASFSFLSPVLGVLFGWLILDETLSPAILAALVLVCSGVFLVNRRVRTGLQR